MITHVRAQLILLADVQESALVEKLLTLLEQDPVLPPTHWGAGMGLRDPYERAAVLEAVRSAEPGELVPHVRRLRPVRYEAWWYSEQAVLSSFQLESRLPIVPEAPRALCEAMSRLASVLPVDYGHVDLRFEPQERSTYMDPSGSFDHLGFYGRLGPETLYPRTFFGPRLLNMVGGVDALRVLGPALQPLDNGVWQLDLVPEPWSSEPVSLKQAQLPAQAELRLAGLLTQSVDGWKSAPGARWRPLLGDVAVHGEQGPPFTWRS
jgi:hypothetical protein